MRGCGSDALVRLYAADQVSIEGISGRWKYFWAGAVAVDLGIAASCAKASHESLNARPQEIPHDIERDTASKAMADVLRPKGKDASFMRPRPKIVC